MPIDPTFFQKQLAKAKAALFGDALPEFPGILPRDGPGSVYGGSNLQAPTERWTDIKRRGGAPLTFGAVGTAVGNAAIILGSSAVTGGFANMAERALGLSPGSLGGFANVPGHFAIDYRPGQRLTITQYHDDVRRAETRAARERAESYAASRAGAGGSSRGRLGGGLGGGFKGDPGGAPNRGGTGPK
jgi:hypothetical protein